MVDRGSVMRRIRQPASAAVAGIVFAVLLGAVIVLMRDVVPASPADIGLWADDEQRRASVGSALGLMPFAGIALLWFIAVLRSQVGAVEDRFVGTVFLGSGLLFVAMLFGAAASLRAVLSLQEAGVVVAVETRAFGWALAAALLGSFGTRMAAVFVATAATAGRRAGSLPRWIAITGYAVTVLLLLTPPLPTFVQFLFPAWVLLLSGYLLTGRHLPAPGRSLP